MDQYIKVELKGRVNGGASIEFLQAVTSGTFSTPFALVHYAIGGARQDYGLRLDMDKRAFLDHLDDPNQQRVIEYAAPVIVGLISDRLVGQD